MNGGPWTARVVAALATAGFRVAGTVHEPPGRAAARVVAAWAAAGCRVAGVALGDINLHFAWQTWHLETSTVTLRGRRGTYGTGLALVARLGLFCHTPSFTHNFVIPSLSHITFTHTHYLSHTTLSHTIFDTPLCHTTSVTHHLS